MGGYGSGRWGWHTPKRTVESAKRFDIGYLVRSKMLGENVSGTMNWEKSWVRWYTKAHGDEAFVFTLFYTIRSGAYEGESIELPVLVFPTPMPKGGKRYWFRCPIQGCRKPRVGKLMLPPGSRYFGCRQCHRLVYRSSQDSRKPCKLIMNLGLAEGLTSSQIRRLFS